MRYESKSADDTRRVAAELAGQAKPGEIYCLRGELGAGKTVFTQGFARGLGYDGGVTSPTFTLVHEYIGGRLPLYHFDLYRLEGGDGDADEAMESLGYEEYFYGGGICLVEWPERAGGIIPRDAKQITIKVDYKKDIQRRDIEWF